jgi:hypothetical protein
MLKCPDAPPPHPAGLAAATRHSASRQVGRTFNPGDVFDLTTDLDSIAEAYAAIDERRAIKSLVRVGDLGSRD